MVKARSDQAWHPNIWFGGVGMEMKEKLEDLETWWNLFLSFPKSVASVKERKAKNGGNYTNNSKKKISVVLCGLQNKDYQSELSQWQSLKKFTSQVCSATLWVINLHNRSWRSNKALNNLDFTRLPNNISPLGEISEEIGDIMTQ